jgi:ABC-2 type transport system permease protein
MRPALHAEWTKLRTVAGPLWLLLGMIVATVALSAAASSVATKPSLVGVVLGQALVVILAVLVISGEYSSGLIRTTLSAMPRRATVFAAKAITLSGVVAVAATVAVLGSFVAAHDHSLDGRAILYLILIAWLSLGIAAVVRDSATSIGVVLGLLYLPPILAQAIGDPDWQRRLEQIAPTSAGLGVTAGWALAALAAGGLSLRLRDA